MEAWNNTDFCVFRQTDKTNAGYFLIFSNKAVFSIGEHKRDILSQDNVELRGIGRAPLGTVPEILKTKEG